MMLNICLHVYLHGYFPKTKILHEVSGWTCCSFSVRLLVFFLLSLESTLYSEYHPLMKIHCENISCHSVVCLFHSLNSIFHRASFFNFDEIVYFLWIVISVSWQKSFCLTTGPEDFLFFKKSHSFIFHTWKYGPFWDSP